MCMRMHMYVLLDNLYVYMYIYIYIYMHIGKCVYE